VSPNEPSAETAPTISTAAELRRLFDASFAAPASLITEPLEHLLAIRVGSDPFALRLSDVAGLYVGVKIVPVPSPVAQLLGIVGIRGMMAPIYDLAALLRYPPASNARWFVFARAPQLVGFAFEAFESHLQVPRASVATGNGENADMSSSGQHVRARVQHMRGSVRVDGTRRPIIHLASMVEMIGGKNS
jgi:chemotaxis signal transduction protein